ncbi:MAG: SMI1/KNR4 family protein [Verrucomicrobiaceae bacterium]|nr:SMI1/KNR4 family protein [Verrucomicrobiaceae bacterium]
MKKIWSKLEGELTAKAGSIIESLNLGAEESEIEELEENIGQELPTDYRDFLLAHNGQSQESNPGFFDMFSLMPLELVQESWAELENLRDDAGEENACPGDWLPFAEDGSGDLLCVELESGAVSKFINDDSNEAIADSFEEWLTDIYATLINAEFTFDPSSGCGIEPKVQVEEEEEEGATSTNDEDDVVMDEGNDDDDGNSQTYTFTAKVIEIFEGEEKMGAVPWGDVTRVRVSSYAGEPLVSLNLPEGNDPEEIELSTHIPNAKDLYKYLGKLKGWDSDVFQEALAGAGGDDDETVVWQR